MILADMFGRAWNTMAGAIASKCVVWSDVTITRQDADLDIYVCEFMCTPFTPNRERKGWADENAKTFWSALKTIATLRPRTFVLENVKAISNNSNSEVVENAMNKLIGYTVVSIKMNSTDYDVPQHRPRVYMIGFRNDGLPQKLLKIPKSMVHKLL